MPRLKKKKKDVSFLLLKFIYPNSFGAEKKLRIV